MTHRTGRLTELFQLTRMRFLLFLREPEAVFWTFAFPMIMAVVLGFAFSERGIEDARIGVVVSDAAPATELIQALEAAESIEVETYRDPQAAAKDLGSASIDALVVPGPPPSLRFDPARPEGDTARLRIVDAIQAHAGRTDPVEITVTEVKETGSRYVDWLIPGLLGMNIMGTGIYGIGFAIADTRQKKLLKRFLVTPMLRSSFLFSFILSRLAFLILEVAAVLLFARFVLGVPIRGSLVSLGAMCIIGSLVFSGLGILIASRVRTIEGVSGLMNLALLPMWLFCGTFFSYERFGETFEPIIRLLPLTALNDGLRAIMLDAEGFSQILPEIGIQIAWGVLTFAIGLRIFRWQ